MMILEVPQGYWSDLTGTPRSEALATFAKFDADFHAKYPNSTPRQSWHEFEVKATQRASMGYEWYTVDEAGLLTRHSAQYDSSG